MDEELLDQLYDESYSCTNNGDDLQIVTMFGSTNEDNQQDDNY